MTVHARVQVGVDMPQLTREQRAGAVVVATASELNDLLLSILNGIDSGETNIAQLAARKCVARVAMLLQFGGTLGGAASAASVDKVIEDWYRPDRKGA